MNRSPVLTGAGDGREATPESSRDPTFPLPRLSVFSSEGKFLLGLYPSSPHKPLSFTVVFRRLHRGRRPQDPNTVHLCVLLQSSGRNGPLGQGGRVTDVDEPPVRFLFGVTLG